jgi:hypothetical protein
MDSCSGQARSQSAGLRCGADERHSYVHATHEGTPRARRYGGRSAGQLELSFAEPAWLRASSAMSEPSSAAKRTTGHWFEPSTAHSDLFSHAAFA